MYVLINITITVIHYWIMFVCFCFSSVCLCASLISTHNNYRPVHVKHERIHYCRNERDVTAGVHSSAILAGICIAFYGNNVQL